MKVKMKQIDKDRLCYTCYGCNRLENSDFNGTYRCLNYIKAERGTNESTKNNQNKK